MLASATRTEAPAVGECCRACCGARRSNVGFKILLAVSLVLVLITWRLLMSNADQHTDERNMTSEERRSISGVRTASRVALAEHNITTLPTNNKSHLYFVSELRRFLSQIHAVCPESVQLGPGRQVCVAAPYRPQPPCLIYTFGVEYDFGFTDDAALLFDCTVRAFDPRPLRNHRRSEHAWFYRDIKLYNNNNDDDDKNHVGVAANGSVVYTLSQLVDKLNDSNTTIAYLKLNLESDAAWSALDHTLRSGELNDVQQLGLTVHVTSGRHQRRQATQQWSVLLRLERAGFRRWICLLDASTTTDAAIPQRRTDIYQLAYVNKRFLV